MPIHFRVTGANFGVTKCKKVKIALLGVSCSALRCYILNSHAIFLANLIHCRALIDKGNLGVRDMLVVMSSGVVTT